MRTESQPRDIAITFITLSLGEPFLPGELATQVEQHLDGFGGSEQRQEAALSFYLFLTLNPVAINSGLLGRIFDAHPEEQVAGDEEDYW